MTAHSTIDYKLITEGSNSEIDEYLSKKVKIDINKINLLQEILENMNWPPGDCVTVRGYSGAHNNVLVDIDYGLALLNLPEKKKGRKNKYTLRAIYSSETALKNFEEYITQDNPITFDIKGKVLGDIPKTTNTQFNKVLAEIISKVPEIVAHHKIEYSFSYYKNEREC